MHEPLRARTGLVLAALTGIAFAVRLLRLSETAEPPGTDGYYYVVQAEDWLDVGRLHVPDGSWALRWLGAWAGLGRAAGVGLITGIKAGAAALAALCVPAAFAAGRALRGRGGAWALALWAAASPTLTHLAGDFPKNLGVVAPLLVAAAFAAGRGRVAGLVVAAGLAATAHRVGAALVGLAALGAAAGWVARRAGGDPRLRRALVGVGGASLAFAAVAALTPGLLHPTDLSRLSGQLAWPPSGLPPLPFFALRPTHPWQQAELLAPWGVAALALVAFVRTPEARPALAAGLVPLAACLCPLWRGDALDLGYRLALLAPLVAAALAAVAWPAGWRLPRAALAAGALLVPASRVGFNPALLPPYDQYRAILHALPKPYLELMIMPQGMSFLYDHETGREAMAWAPEPALDRASIGRVAWGIRPGEWAACAPDAQPRPTPLGGAWWYVREDVWEAFAAAARAGGDDELLDRVDDPRNPAAVRPESLTRGR